MQTHSQSQFSPQQLGIKIVWQKLILVLNEQEIWVTYKLIGMTVKPQNCLECFPPLFQLYFDLNSLNAGKTNRGKIAMERKRSSVKYKNSSATFSPFLFPNCP